MSIKEGETSNKRIQIINDRKMLDGKFCILDSDNDSENEELYGAKKDNVQQTKKK
jgi:hypothetical protein